MTETTDALRSSEFNPDLIGTLLGWGEGYRLDFKETYYRLDEEEGKSKFIKHCIAFANTARRTGKSCYMVFGVADKDHSLKNIQAEYPGGKYPPWWSNPDTSVRKKQTDGVDKRIRDAINEYITPRLDIGYEYGEYKGVFISYITFDPLTPCQPYSLTKPIKGEPQGSVFIRSGANSVRVVPALHEHLLSFSQAIYLEPRQWGRLISHYTGGDFFENQNLTPVFHPKIDGAQQDAREYILDKIINNKRTAVIITAPAGDGKTVLLHRLAFSIAKLHNVSMINENKNYHSDQPPDEDDIPPIMELKQLEQPPTRPIPIYLSLRTNISSLENFGKIITNKVKEILQDECVSNWLERPDQLFKIPDTRWVLLLDGIDELRDRERAGKVLEEWLSILPDNVSVIMTSRPYAVEGLTAYDEIQLAPLKDKEIHYLIEGKIRARLPNETDSIIQETQEIIQDPEWSTFLFRQRAIDGFVNYVTETPVAPTAEIDHTNFDNLLSPPSEELHTIHPKPEVDKIPVIDNDELIGDDSKLPPYLPKTEDPPDNILQFYRSIAIQRVIDHISSEEIKRNAFLGSEKREQAEKAKHELGELAWKLSWETDKFNSKASKPRISHNAVKWNEYVGFIKRKEFPYYEFINLLTRAFFSAHFAFSQINDNQKMINRFYETTNHLSSLTKTLYIELCQTNGQESYLRVEDK